MLKKFFILLNPSWLLKNLSKGIIQLYRTFVSPWLPPSCRFVPTCSQYALEALDKYSFFRAFPLMIYRLVRCHPFSKGGYDPVP